MSSFARRTLRTTAAAAGMAALGVGLAGNALAAPDEADRTPAPAPSPALPVMGAVPVNNPLASLPRVPQNLGQLPMLFVFQGPTVNTAGPSPDAAPARTHVAHVDADGTGDSGDTDAPETDTTADADLPSRTPGTDRVGALSTLDSAGLFDSLTPQSVVDVNGLGAGHAG